MDKEEARSVLAQRLSEYRAISYEELAGRLGTTETDEVSVPSGAAYQLEFQFFWDSKPNGDIRVLGSIGDGSLRTFINPLGDDFIVAPDGTFVGE